MINYNNQTKKGNGLTMLPLYLALFCVPFSIVGGTISNNLLVRIGSYGIIFASIICLICVIINSKKLLCFLFLLSMSALSFLLSNSANLDSLFALFHFIELPVLILYVRTFGVDRGFVKTIFMVFYAISWYLFGLYFSEYAYVSEYGKGVLKVITLGFINPNLTAIILFVCFTILFCAIFFHAQWYIKVLFFPNVIMMIWLIFLTESRVCILLTIMFLIFIVFIKLVRFSPFSCFVSVLVPVIFVILSYWLSNVRIDIMVLGESFETGRLNIYEDLFDNLNLIRITFGDFGKYDFSNMHNAYLSVFATIGLFGLLFFVIFLYLSLRHLIYRINTVWQKVAYFGMLSLIFHSSVEAVLFSFGSYFAVLVLAIYCIANCNEEMPKVRKGI